MKTRIFLLVAAAAMAFTAICCSKDDDGDPSDPGSKVPDPMGVVEMNMRNASNGKTFLGTVYIDEANNFTGASCVDLGAMKGLGNITRFTMTGNSYSCAVTPGHGYLFFSKRPELSHVFSSGVTAYSIDNLYRVYVDSYILSAVNTIMGAKIKYQNPFNPEGLPLTWEEYRSADPEAKGWEVETRGYANGTTFYVRSNDLYVMFNH